MVVRPDAPPLGIWHHDGVVSLDFRSRIDSDIRSRSTQAFFEGELPALIEERSARAVSGARELGVEPFTIETPSGTWTLSLVDDRLVVTRGDSGTACVRLSDDDVSDIVNDLK